MSKFVPRDEERLLTPSEVSVLFRVDPKTVTRWAKAGKLSSVRTLGGHRRYKESEVRALLAGIPAAAAAHAAPVVPEGTCPECRYPFGSPGHATSSHTQAA